MHQIQARRLFVKSAPHSAALFVFSFYGLQSFCVFHLRGPPGSCRRLFGRSWGPCGASACLLGVIGGLWAPLWDVSGLSGGLLRASWGPLGIPGCLLGVPGRPLAVSVGLWVPSGVLLGVSLGVSSGSRAPPGRVWALAGHLYAWIAAVAPAPPGTPPLSLSNSYHFGDFSASTAPGPDSVSWPACENPSFSLLESYHLGDFSVSAAPGPDSVIWPACVNHHFLYQNRIISVISRPRRLEGQIPSFGRPVETHHFLYQNRIISVISRPRRLQGQIPSFGRPA